MVYKHRWNGGYTAAVGRTMLRSDYAGGNRGMVEIYCSYSEDYEIDSAIFSM